MNIEQISFSFVTMQWVVISVIGVYSWLVGRQAASTKELLELRTRITTLEAEMRQVPDHKQINEVLARSERLEAQLEGVNTQLGSVTRSLELINSYLLNKREV